ncbi:uncharacterized protein N7483_006943 [Penicillium malachiteum]|uniref:uncharacterized protein n=1 Tax=Penicillium malachiteum TaxID=1324776 RepID=UPI002547F5C1|nr:uncharacterized protein N7483_006943 [Penicillium malachiteum]KAJ5725586.1 hypothetical protein N7483_006943 [Penicillium malachiteum]
MASTSRQRKPRASCDSCNEARVRCSQARPTCERCVKNKINCVYGISQRAGRNRASTHRSADDQTTLAGGHRRPSTSDPVLLLQHPGHAQIPDEFPINSIPLLDDLTMGLKPHEFPNSNHFPEMFTEMFTDSSPLSSNWNQSDMSSTVSLGNCAADTATCTCVSSIFSFFSTHPILTGTNPAPIDACLEQGRESINLCERVLNCIGFSQHHYSSLVTVALFIDRVVAIYDRAKQHYQQTLFVMPYHTESSTRSSSSLSLANSMSTAHTDISREDIFAHLDGSIRQSAYIGEYQLDKDDYVKLTFEIVFGHLARVEKLLRIFKNGTSRDDHLVSTTTGGIALVQPTSDHELEYDHQTLVCVKLAELIEQQLNITRNGWESTCKEWELYQMNGR